MKIELDRVIDNKILNNLNRYKNTDQSIQIENLKKFIYKILSIKNTSKFLSYCIVTVKNSKFLFNRKFFAFIS